MREGSMERREVTRQDVTSAVVEAVEPRCVEPLHGPAEAIIAKCKAELAQSPSSERAARLHHEIAQSYESVLGDFLAASTHYERALAEAPHHVPAIRGARRVLIEIGRFADVLPLYEAETRVTP